MNVLRGILSKELDYRLERNDEISARRAKEIRIEIQKLEEQKRIVLGDDEK